MNFKFTTTKTIVSLVISLIVGHCFFALNKIYDVSRSFSLKAQLIGFLYGFIISFVLIYLIWSLFQKKRR
jgi:hypothetical protein